MPKLNDTSLDWCGFWAFPASFNKSRPWPLPASAKGRQPLHPRCLSKVEVPRVDCTKIIEDIKAFQLYVRVNMYHTYREMGSYGIISSRSILYHYIQYMIISYYIRCKLWHWNCLMSHVAVLKSKTQVRMPLVEARPNWESQIQGWSRCRNIQTNREYDICISYNCVYIYIHTVCISIIIVRLCGWTKTSKPFVPYWCWSHKICAKHGTS